MYMYVSVTVHVRMLIQSEVMIVLLLIILLTEINNGLLISRLPIKRLHVVNIHYYY